MPYLRSITRCTPSILIRDGLKRQQNVAKKTPLFGCGILPHFLDEALSTFCVGLHLIYFSNVEAKALSYTIFYKIEYNFVLIASQNTK